MQAGYVELLALEDPEEDRKDAGKEQPPHPGLSYSSGRFRNGAIGLCNIGATNCLNPLLQTLYMSKDFTDLLCRIGGSHGSDIPRDWSFPHQLLALFREMQESKEDAVGPYRIVHSLQSVHPRVLAKSDVAEVFSALLSLIFQTVADQTLGEEMRSLYTIPLEERVTCQRCLTQRSAPRSLISVPLRVCHSKFHRKMTLERSLWRFFRLQEIPEEENHCEKCQQSSRGAKVTQLRSLPRMLSIHLKRLSKKNAHQLQKVNRPVSFPPLLDLLEVLDPDSLPEEEHPAPRYTYRLTSVVAHSGTASLGHFCAYINSHKDGRWYFFNDSSVCKVSWDDVKCTYGNKAFQWGVTACLLLYTQTDSV